MDPVAPLAPAPVPVVDPPAPAAPPVVAPAPVAGDIASLPEWAQKVIKDAREEAGKDRIKAKETAAAEARQALAREVGKALGLIDESDPVEAAKTAAERAARAEDEAKAIKFENAVLRRARAHDVDPEALTDSRSFMARLSSIDPAAADFAAQVDAAIKAAVEANPLLRLTPAPAPRSGGPVGGGAPTPGQLTRDDLKGMKPEDIVKAKAEGRLNQLLGIT